LQWTVANEGRGRKAESKWQKDAEMGRMGEWKTFNIQHLTLNVEGGIGRKAEG
jgi:hypothetical protein